MSSVSLTSVCFFFSLLRSLCFNLDDCFVWLWFGSLTVTYDIFRWAFFLEGENYQCCNLNSRTQSKTSSACLQFGQEGVMPVLQSWWHFYQLHWSQSTIVDIWWMNGPLSHSFTEIKPLWKGWVIILLIAEPLMPVLVSSAQHLYSNNYKEGNNIYVLL